jgi:hypothetical protein
LWQVITDSVPTDPSLTDLETSVGMPGRVFSTMGNPNNFAEILIMTFPFTLVMFFNAKNITFKICYVICSSTTIASLMYTGSRSCWIGFAFSIFILVLFRRPSWIPLLFFAGVILLPFLPDYIQRRLITIVNFDSDSSALYRVKIFNTVLPMIQDYWKTGVGLGTDVFMKISSRYYLYTYKVPVHTHILYTQILIEIGIIGLLTFLWTITRNIKNTIKEIFTTEDKFLSNILIAGVSSLSGILLVSFVEYVWYYPRVMLVFWLVFSLTMSGIYISRSSRLKSFV